MSDKNYKITVALLWAVIAILVLLNISMGLSYWKMKNDPLRRINTEQIYQEYLGDLSE